MTQVNIITPIINSKKFNQFETVLKKLYPIKTVIKGKSLTTWKLEWEKILTKLPNPEQAITALNLFVENIEIQIANNPNNSRNKGNIPDDHELLEKRKRERESFTLPTRFTKLKLIEQSFFNLANFHRLTTLFSNSPGLTRFFLKEPARYISDVLAPVSTIDEFKTELANWLTENTQSEKKTDREILEAIRILKVKSYLRISVADYLELDSFETTVEKISFFAETSIQYAMYHSGLQELPIAVIAMGKLGGNELNYNSDIDVMFVASNAFAKHHNYKSPHDTVLRIQVFITLLSEFTSNGTVHKVDLRIRPEGDQGPLYLTLEQYYNYYQNRAESWEFQALIKARAVGGDSEVGKQFEEFRAKWVFNPDFSSKKMLLSISRIKQNIEKFHKPHEYRDIKLAPGGIRDMEFIVQFLQIHHGKITRVLSHTNTLATLDKFLTYKIITPRQHKLFRSHYCFLRQVEHYLQLIDLLPVRSLPKDEKLLLVIAQMMGYMSTSELENKIREVMNFNQDLFLRIFKLTTGFYEKIDEIKKQLLIEGLDSSTEHLAYFAQHISHLESDYFLNFSAQKIIRHIKLLQKLVNESSVIELKFNTVKGEKSLSSSASGSIVELELVTNDHKGIFSLICGLVSLHGISINEGASFLYQKSSDTDKITQNTNMLRFDNFSNLANLRQDEGGKENQHEVIKKHIEKNQLAKKLAIKRVIFSMQGVFINSEAEEQFKAEDFYVMLKEAILEMGSKQPEKTMEKILFHSLTAFKKFGLEPNQEQLKLIQLDIDNTSHPLYTIVDIKSEDSFLFLFFFTYALSFKGYYIIKFEFSTPKNQIRNRIFLTDYQRGKIHDENKLIELKSSILLIKYFSAFMKDAPNPSLAYKTFNRLINAMEVKQYSDNEHTDFYLLFKDLVKVLGTGEIIMEDFLRLQHGDIRTFLRDKKNISEPLTKTWIESRLKDFFASNTTDLSSKNLNVLKDQLLFHLDLRLLTGAITNFGDFCEEMSNLTDVVMTKAVNIAIEQTLEKFELDHEPGRHALVALGKWGSREMGYSSDVELVFIYDHLVTNNSDAMGGNYDTTNRDLVKNFYVFVGNLLPGIIESKKNGIFEVDLRLRPEGENSTIAVSLSKFKNYYAPEGRYLNYEKMVLTRLRVVDGESKLATEIQQVKNYFVYEMDNFDLDNFKEIRKKQIIHLTHDNEKSAEMLYRVNIKFSAGGLVDIEYLVQILSIKYGREYTSVRVNSTLGVVEELKKLKLIDTITAEEMITSYKFLRNLINCLRIMRGNSKDMELPERGSLEMEYLKRTMVNFKAIEEKEDLYEKIRWVMDRVISLQERCFLTNISTNNL